MSRKGSDFAGLAVAIVTPFKDGKLDMDRLKEQVEFLLIRRSYIVYFALTLNFLMTTLLQEDLSAA